VFQNVYNFLAIGPFTKHIPGRPQLPSPHSERYLLAIPSKPNRTGDGIHWIMFASDGEME